MKMNKIKALGMMTLMACGLFAITGCDKDPLLDQNVKAAIEAATQAAYAEGASSVDITADNDKVAESVLAQVEAVNAEQAVKDAQVLADYQAELELVKEELVAKEASIVISNEEIAIEEAISSRDSYTKDELALESPVTMFTLDQSDLDFLQDGKIEFKNDDNIDIKEELKFGNVGIRTSKYDREFDSDVYLTVEAENGIEYKYVFDDNVNSSLITKEEPLKINFLGEDIEIVNVDSDAFTVIKGEELFMQEGELITIQIEDVDVSVELVSVADSTNKVAIRINGVLKSGIDEFDVASIGDYEVYVSSVMANEAGEGRDIAELRVAKDVTITYDDGDEVINGDERFVYRIALKNGSPNINYLGVAYAEISDNKDDEYAPITGEEQIVFPNDFVKIGLALKDNEYIDYDFKFTTKDDVKAIKISSSDEEGIVIGTDKVDKIYFNSTNVLYNDDNGDEQVVALSAVKLENDDTSLNMTFDGANFTIGANIVFVTDVNMSFLGETEDKAEAGDITYLGLTYGTRDESLMTSTGIIIKDPENNADSDTFELRVPKDTVKAEIIVE